MPIPIPFPPFILNFPVPPRIVIPIIQTVLETCRMLVSNSLYDIERYRKLLSIVIGVFDISRGEWKDGILSLLGFYSMDLMNVGKNLKMMRWIYNFISPDIQVRLEDDIYSASKSIFVGSFLWIISIVSPATVRITINKLLTIVNMPIEKLHRSFDRVQTIAKREGAKMGAEVVFPNFPLDNVPSFEDIQNFQSLAHTPEIFCSDEFQEILSYAIVTPALRLCLELMNIPTIPEKVTEKCKNHKGTISETLTESMMPTVIQTGGGILENFVKQSLDGVNIKPAEKSMAKATKNVLKTSINVTKDSVSIADNLRKDVAPIVTVVSNTMEKYILEDEEVKEDNDDEANEDEEEKPKKSKKSKHKTRKARHQVS
jgi:hypothetical protein